MICSSGGSKSRLATAAGAKPSRQMRNQKHFWKLRYWKTAHGCGTKHMWKSKCTKRLRFGALLEVEMFKKCTPLWREAHFEVKSAKKWGIRSTFGSWDVQKVHGVKARSIFGSKNVKNTSEQFWKLRCSKSARCCGAKHMFKSKMVTAPHIRTTFGTWDVEKVHSVVVRSTFGSQKVLKWRSRTTF